MSIGAQFLFVSLSPLLLPIFMKYKYHFDDFLDIFQRLVWQEKKKLYNFFIRFVKIAHKNNWPWNLSWIAALLHVIGMYRRFFFCFCFIILFVATNKKRAEQNNSESSNRINFNWKPSAWLFGYFLANDDIVSKTNNANKKY